MEQEDRIQSEAERRKDEEALARHLERARNVANNWPEWKRNSGLRWWPNGASPAEAKEEEPEAENVEPECESKE